MKNVFILMLCLLIFQITSLTAQVRIGGLTEPNKATVLDLNASDATNDGSRGLALPRVSLADTLALLNGTVPPDGVMVYNTNTVLGEGVYVWSSDKWSQVIMPLRADSGQYMQYNGKDWVPATLGVVTRSMQFQGWGYPSISSDSTGFGTARIALYDCPCILDMVPVHGVYGYSIFNGEWTMWSVYFENHQDSIYHYEPEPGKITDVHLDVYTMGFMLRSIDWNNGKPYWGGSPTGSHGPIPATFRCLKF